MDEIDSRFLEACDLPKSEAYTEPFAMVVFGATGDLARRKLLPTLFGLYREKMVSSQCHIIGAGRRKLSDRQRMCGGVLRPKIVIEKPFGTDKASAATRSCRPGRSHRSREDLTSPPREAGRRHRGRSPSDTVCHHQG